MFDSCALMQEERSSPGLQLPLAARAVESTVLVLICLLSLMTNLLLWVTVLRFGPLRRSRVNMLLLSHSLSQLLDAGISVPITTHSVIMGKLSFGCEVCQFMGFVTTLTFVVGLISLTALAINRYIRVCRGMWYPAFYHHNYIFIHILAIWITGAVWASGPLVDWGQYHYTQGMLFCTLESGHSWPSKISGAAVFVIQISIVICCYIAIFYNFYNRRQEVLMKSRLSTVSAGSRTKSLRTALKQASGMSLSVIPFRGKQLSIIEEITDGELTSDRLSVNRAICETISTKDSPTPSTSPPAVLCNKTITDVASRGTGIDATTEAEEWPVSGSSTAGQLSKSSSNEDDEDKWMAHERRFAAAMLGETAVFCVSLLPIIHFTVLSESTDVSSTWKVAFLLLAYANSMVSPVFYCWGNSHIRQGFRLMCTDFFKYSCYCKARSQVAPGS